MITDEQRAEWQRLCDAAPDESWAVHTSARTVVCLNGVDSGAFSVSGCPKSALAKYQKAKGIS